ncbi:MAG: cupin domain-containing protein [Gammaproteobacteria bacterium]|nr:cupin domain-containing protein [Gammaproteobacteria bacterium]MDH5803295.1 cupin domain-containing protein [Gammaproteobacteria bacterium]
MDSKQQSKIVTVRSPNTVHTQQGLPYFVGLSEDTAGTKGISMNLVVIPPGATAKAHIHKTFETGIYVLEGRVETRYGDNLEHSVINQAGDFVFIPPDLLHRPTNLNADAPAKAIVVRNDANEFEDVIVPDDFAEAC